MGATTGGRGSRPPESWTDLTNFLRSFWWGSGGGNRQRQTGYTFLKKILEKASNTPGQEIGPLNFENVIAHLVGHTVQMDVLSPIISVLCHSG